MGGGQGDELRLLPGVTSWGAPLVWGDSEASAWRRAEFAERTVRTGLVVLAVGRHARFLRRLLYSAEVHFLPDRDVTYYVLTDSPRELHPPPPLRPRRELRVVPVAEAPGWERLARRRMGLLAAAIKEEIQHEVDYVFCADVDQEFTGPVGAEILGRLVATLHPEYYGKPHRTYPYERDSDSLAYVVEGEGDYYYTSELYGGLCSEVLALAQACAQLTLQDGERGVRAQELEESYLNRYLASHRPTCVLSPEYSWWASPLVSRVPTQRVLSLGRQCASVGNLRGDIC